MRVNDYYYQQLQNEYAITYRNIYDCLKNHSFHCKAPFIDGNKLRNVFGNVIDDHPELYYVSSKVKGGARSSGGSKFLELGFEELYQIDQRKIDKEISRVVNDISLKAKGKSELEQHMLILDYLIENVTYEINNVFNQNAASAIYYHKAQCSGISAAYKLIADSLGLFALIASSSSNESGVMMPHAWNIVQIDGLYYHIDATSVIGRNKNKEKPYSYKNAFCSDEFFRVNHILQPGWPKCTDTKYERLSEFNGNKTSVLKEICSFYELRSYLTEQVKAHEKNVTFYYKIDMAPALFESSLANSIKSVFLNLQIPLKSASFSKSGYEVQIQLVY